MLYQNMLASRPEQDTTSQSRIFATSQQTRFNPNASNATEIDLHDVTISIGERDVLNDARLRLKDGVRYGLVGKNGCGKSSKRLSPLHPNPPQTES